MAKSMRSKWRKKMKAEKARVTKPAVADRLTGLNGKLHLAAAGGLSKVPAQEPRKEFHFTPPVTDVSSKLTLPAFTTNVHKGLRGHEGPEGPHPQLKNQRSPKAAPTTPGAAALAGTALAAASGRFAEQGAQRPTDVATRYQQAASTMASDFVPSLEMVLGKKGMRRQQQKGSAAAQDDDDDDAVAPRMPIDGHDDFEAPTFNAVEEDEEQAPRVVRLASAVAAKKSRTGKMSKSVGGAVVTKKRAGKAGRK